MFWLVFTCCWDSLTSTEILVQITRVENPLLNTLALPTAAVFVSRVGSESATGLATVMAVMYNLVSDVVGGIEIVGASLRWQSPPQRHPRGCATPAPRAEPMAGQRPPTCRHAPHDSCRRPRLTRRPCRRHQTHLFGLGQIRSVIYTLTMPCGDRDSCRQTDLQ